MGRTGLFQLLALLVVAACSSGGGNAASTTTTSVTSTTLATTTTTSPEDAVRAAWNGYWAMATRLLQAPNPDDPELGTRAIDPLLTSLRDDLSTRAAQGRHIVIPAGAKYDHRLDGSTVSGSNATIVGCKFDDSVLLGPNGETIDDTVTTADIRAKLVLSDGSWKFSDVRFENQRPGIVACGN